MGFGGSWRGEGAGNWLHHQPTRSLNLGFQALSIGLKAFNGTLTLDGGTCSRNQDHEA